MGKEETESLVTAARRRVEQQIAAGDSAGAMLEALHAIQTITEKMIESRPSWADIEYDHINGICSLLTGRKPPQ